MHVGSLARDVKFNFFNFGQNENDIPIKDDTVAENWGKN